MKYEDEFNLFTPRNVSVSSKKVRIFEYDCYSIFLSIALSVEDTCIPAMQGGAVA